MAAQEKTRRDVDTLRTLIHFEVDQLDSEMLSADERRVIKDHLDELISELQTLLRASKPAGRTDG